MSPSALEYVFHQGQAPGEFRLTKIEAYGKGADRTTELRIVAESPDGEFVETMRSLTFEDLHLTPELRVVK